METEPERKIENLFVFGFVFELCLVPVAAILGYWLTGNAFPFRLELLNLVWVRDGILWGVAATVPIGLLPLLATSPIGRRITPLRVIYERVKAKLGDALLRLSTGEVILLAASAGIGEEVLFRGVLHNSIGIVWTSILFGLLHALTFTYFILAALISFYFGWLYDITNFEGVPGGGHLLVPIIVHWLYDVLALVFFRRRLREDLAENAADNEADESKLSSTLKPTQSERNNDDFSEDH